MIPTDEPPSSLLLCAPAAAVLDVLVVESTGLDVTMLLLLWDTIGSVDIIELVIVTVDTVDVVTTVTVVAEVMVISLVDTIKVVGVTIVISLLVTTTEVLAVTKTKAQDFNLHAYIRGSSN